VTFVGSLRPAAVAVGKYFDCAGSGAGSGWLLAASPGRARCDGSFEIEGLVALAVPYFAVVTTVAAAVAAAVVVAAFAAVVESAAAGAATAAAACGSVN